MVKSKDSIVALKKYGRTYPSCTYYQTQTPPISTCIASDGDSNSEGVNVNDKVQYCMSVCVKYYVSNILYLTEVQ